MASRVSERCRTWAAQPSQVRRALLVVAIAAITARACFARVGGLNPESLWYDDVAWAVFTRAQNFRTMVLTPVNAPPAFLALLWTFRALFRDPEWSLQLLPFLCALAAIPVMAGLVWRLTRSEGLALLAAGLTALNPLLAHYSVFVKHYSLDFLVTALVLLLAVAMLDGREIHPWKVLQLTVFSGLGLLASVTSGFVSLPAVNVVALRAWRTKQRATPAILLIAAAFNLALIAAYLLVRSRTRSLIAYHFQEEFLRRLSNPFWIWTFAVEEGRRVVEMSLPSWKETRIWDPETVSWTLPFMGLGLIWLPLRRSTRAVGYIVLLFLAAFLVAAYTKLYPLTTDRRSIFAFPVFISLAIMGLHLLTEWIPKREIVRLVVGLFAAGFALYAPLHVEYWAVSDVRLVQHLSASAEPADGLIISPNGVALAAYYGSWPVRVGGKGINAGATIGRAFTLPLPRRQVPRAPVESFLGSFHPARIWYMAFRTRDEDELGVVEILNERGYGMRVVESTTKGVLYFGALPGPNVELKPF